VGGLIMWKIKIFSGRRYGISEEELEEKVNDFIVKNKIENFSLETSQSNYGDYGSYLIITMKYKVNSEI
jgi:hypothetical protein